MSLALADMLIIMAALPESLLLPFVGEKWPFSLGELGCAIVIFLRSVGRNFGSLM